MGEETSLLVEALGRPSAHLCIDMQRLFAPEGPWPTPWLPRTLPVIASLSERYLPQTVFTRFIPPARAEDRPGQWRHYFERWHKVTREEMDLRLLDLVPPLDRLSQQAVVIDKPVYSPFAGRRLAALLRERKIETLVVTGAETDVCVLAAVLGAVDHGYQVVLVSDAVCSSSDAGHDALMTLYRERFSQQVVVADAEQVREAWSPVQA